MQAGRFCTSVACLLLISLLGPRKSTREDSSDGILRPTSYTVDQEEATSTHVFQVCPTPEAFLVCCTSHSIGLPEMDINANSGGF